MKSVRVIIFCSLIVMFLFSACGGAASTSTTPNVVVKIGWAGSPDTLNPGTAILSEAYVIFELVYSSLFSMSLDGTYEGDLATSWTPSEDGLVWTFEIRPGVTFHDGTPLTANDVVFSFLFYQRHDEFPYMNGYTTVFESVVAPDDHTVVLTLSQPVPSIEYQLQFLFILPEHIWGVVDETASDFENLEMIGSGPFMLIDYAQTEYVHLARNPNWYGVQPHVDEVVFQTFSNQDALVQAIRTGQVDMITEMPNTAVASLREAENVAVVTGPPLAPDVTDIIFNQLAPEDCPPGDGVCSGHPALRDVNVRRALAYATNKAELINIVLLGLGSEGRTLIPDSLAPWYNTSIQDIPFDLDEANRILDNAGYMDVNGDGVREMPDGTNPLIFRLNWPSDSTVAPRLAELISQTWSQIGVQVEMQALDADTLTSICCPAFDYDIIIWGWGSDPDPSFLLSVMLGSEIPSGMNESGYNNPEYAALYDQQSVELDPSVRQDLVWEMQQIVFDDMVYLIPFYSQAVQAYRTDRFTGWLTDQPRLALEDVTSLLVIEPVQ